MVINYIIITVCIMAVVLILLLILTLRSYSQASMWKIRYELESACRLRLMNDNIKLHRQIAYLEQPELCGQHLEVVVDNTTDK